MEILGHANISTTMNTYTHVLPEASRHAADKLDALFTPDADEREDKAADGDADEDPDAAADEER
jgi:hypothetical protein